MSVMEINPGTCGDHEWGPWLPLANFPQIEAKAIAPRALDDPEAPEPTEVRVCLTCARNDAYVISVR